MTNQSLPSRVFVDTGAFYALEDESDADHPTAHRIRLGLADAHSRLFTSNFILDESYTLLLARLGYHYAITFLRQLTASPTTLVRVTPADEERAQQILSTFEDKKFSYTDASSFAVMERLTITHAFTFDHNFEQYGTILLRP